MFDQSYGLRFDVYERIQLSEEVVGISELEEVELLPYIQVINQEEQALLRGHLLLTGIYRGEREEEGTQRLEHYIPVEITVPLHRISSFNEIAVEIENFDIDLLSQRSLNITGVLSLKGIESPEVNNPSWNAEDFTVVHAPDWPSFQDTPSYLRDEELSNAVLEDHPEGSLLHMDEEALARMNEHSNVWAIESEDHVGQTSSTLNSVTDHSSVMQTHEETSLHGSDSALTEENSLLTSESVDSDQSEINDGKAEMKVGFGSKREPSSPQQDHIGLSSILKSSRARSLKDLENQAIEEQLIAQEANKEQERSEEVEWKSLFLGGSSERTPFSKLRLCIVQKQETIDLIADRYEMSPREILLYNRLADQTIEEGQILYIP
ncbi:LysM peptidoglycan-binding domain-containing protein [Paenibacillus sp. CMAA1364]